MTPSPRIILSTLEGLRENPPDTTEALVIESWKHYLDAKIEEVKERE